MIKHTTMKATWNDTSNALSITTLRNNGKLVGYVRDDNYKNWVRIMFWRLMNVAQFRKILLPHVIPRHPTANMINNIWARVLTHKYGNERNAREFFSHPLYVKSIQRGNQIDDTPYLNYKGFRDATATPNKCIRKHLLTLIRMGMYGARRSIHTHQEPSRKLRLCVWRAPRNYRPNSDLVDADDMNCVSISPDDCWGEWHIDRQLMNPYNLARLREKKSWLMVKDGHRGVY